MCINQSPSNKTDFGTCLTTVYPCAFSALRVGARLVFRVQTLFSLGWLLWAQALMAQPAIIGTALVLPKLTPVYEEHYSPPNAHKQVQVTYSTPSGQAFAHKTLTYTGRAFQPLVQFTDTRFNEVLSVQPHPQGWQLLRQQQGLQEQVQLADSAQLVIDAGFNDYIQQHWDSLLQGQIIRFYFALPARLTQFKLSAQKIPAEASPLPQHPQWEYFTLKPSQALLSWVVPPLHLAYQRDTRRLMYFQGRSNISSPEGNNWEVRIQYRYFN